MTQHGRDSDGALRLARVELPAECDKWLIHLRVLAQRGLRGEPKLLFQLLWNAAGCRPGLVTVRLSEIQTSLGWSDSAARRHLKTLTSIGLVDGMDWPATGVVRVSMVDPLQALDDDPPPPPLRLLRGDPQRLLPGIEDSPAAVAGSDTTSGAGSGVGTGSDTTSGAGSGVGAGSDTTSGAGSGVRPPDAHGVGPHRASLRSLRSFVHSFVVEGRDTTERETWLAARKVASELLRGLWPGSTPGLQPRDRRLLLIVGYFVAAEFLEKGFVREAIESTKLNRKPDCPVGKYLWGILRQRLELTKKEIRNVVNRMPVPEGMVDGLLKGPGRRSVQREDKGPAAESAGWIAEINAHRNRTVRKPR